MDATILHTGDIVEELATKRRGAVSIGGTITGNVEVQNNWTVRFTDGKEPILKIFVKRDELRFISCPHSSGEPGFYPARSIME